MRGRNGSALGWVALLAVGLGVGGCAPNPAANLLNGTDQTSAVLNQLTVGDVVGGFQEFRTGLANLSGVNHARGGTAPAPNLTDDQRAQLEALQGRLDAGEITPDEFLQQVRNIVGDALPRAAFAGFEFFGAPLDTRHAGRPFAGRLAAHLELTEEQKQQARDIFTRAHDDIDNLREQAQQDILGLLTDEQRTKLEQLASEGFASLWRDQPIVGRGIRQGVRLILERLAEALEITQEQRDQITARLEQLRTDVKARHQAARDEFRGILTDEQKAKLDALENQGGEPA